MRALRASVARSDEVSRHVRYQDAALALAAGKSQPPAETIAMRRFYDRRPDDGRSPLTPFLQARLQRLDQREEPARLLLEEALRRSPAFYEALHESGLLWWGVQRYGKAADWFRRAAKAAPRRGPAHLALAQVAQELGQWSESARHYQVYLTIEDQDLVAKRACLHVLLYRVEGNPKELEALIQDLWQPGSQDLSLQMDRAAVHWKRGQFQAAADHYRAVLRKDHKRARAALNLGNLLYDTGRSKKPGSAERRRDLDKARKAFLYFRSLGASEDAFDWFDLELAVRVRLGELDKELGKGSSKPVTWRDL